MPEGRSNETKTEVWSEGFYLMPGDRDYARFIWPAIGFLGTVSRSGVVFFCAGDLGIKCRCVLGGLKAGRGC